MYVEFGFVFVRRADYGCYKRASGVPTTVATNGSSKGYPYGSVAAQPVTAQKQATNSSPRLLIM
jgi:hypothetical protein